MRLTLIEPLHKHGLMSLPSSGSGPSRHILHVSWSIGVGGGESIVSGIGLSFSFPDCGGSVVSMSALDKTQHGVAALSARQ
jgi:hypothetical protein